MGCCVSKEETTGLSQTHQKTLTGRSVTVTVKAQEKPAPSPTHASRIEQSFAAVTPVAEPVAAKPAAVHSHPHPPAASAPVTPVQLEPAVTYSTASAAEPIPTVSAPVSQASGVSVTSGTSTTSQPSLPAKKSMRQLAMEKKQRVEQSEREREQQRERGGSMRHKHLLRDFAELTQKRLDMLHAELTFPRGHSYEHQTYFHVTLKISEGIYKGGSFVFEFDVPEDYKMNPPKVRCMTSVFHPNIDSEGHVCLNLLRDDWNPTLNLDHIIVGLLHLFKEPNPGDPLDKEAAELMRRDLPAFTRRARKSCGLR